MNYLEMVKQDGLALRHAPNFLWTAELCLEAVKENGWALFAVPEEMKTAKIYLTAGRLNI